MTLVVGATGLLGGTVCRRLRANGRAVRAFVRPGSPRERDLALLGVEIFHGDLKDPASVEAACQGQDEVVSTATSFTQRQLRGDSIRSVDRDGQLRLVEAARRQGVRRFVYTSLSPNAVSCPFVDAKREVEAAVRASGMEWTNLRPSAFMEIHLSPQVGWNVGRGRAVIIGPGTAPISYISVQDVASFAVHAVERQEPLNRDLPLGGPEALAPLQAARLWEQVTGRALRVRHVPVLLPRALAPVLRPIAPLLSSMMAAGVAVAERGDVVDMAEALRLLPVRLASVRDHWTRVAADRPAA